MSKSPNTPNKEIDFIGAKEYFASIFHKWANSDLPEEVIKDLSNASENLNKLLISLVSANIQIGLLDEKHGLEEVELQRRQILFTSFYLGLELALATMSNVELPNFGDNSINIIGMPMLAYVKKLIDGMKDNKAISLKESEEWFDLSAREIINAANTCFEKGAIYYAKKL